MAQPVSTSFIWHPFTQMKTAPPPLKVVRGHNEMIELADGRQLVDLISSWWTNIHGHAQPEIAGAIYEQALKLEHVLFAGFTHDGAEQLALKLKALLPQEIAHLFFSDNGSTAVEVALKMAHQYFYNLNGQARTSFIAFAGGYHGDTLGAMSIGARSTFFQPFAPLMFNVDVAPFPEICQSDDLSSQREAESLQAINDLLESRPDY